ncbi:DUF4230 domain-containing protein [Asanoa sp. WMMD1127]|uniref:DUF4230 domain-containing protein n=1 Tax=Asanoa sp. WMMD1127 TaxID=3016107 RepID=UPI002416D481|nr:DUF4230 domain-containing protein [Asanoa sp. WMMD1127]MDG4821502.1 DUF4230 domain-containing protein [Asanoa sp. WMMD1127]
MTETEPTREYPEVNTRTDERQPADPAYDQEPSRPPRWRGLIWLAAIVVVLVAGGFALKAADLLPNWRNPFAQETTDRSQPPLLKSIQDLSRYVAAEGNFQVIVDKQTSRDNIPEFLLNERTLFVGVGTVEAYVDFGQLAEGAIVESPDGKSVEVKLPAPQLGEVNLNTQDSYVFAEERGLANRLGDLIKRDPNQQQEIYTLAEEKIKAAAVDSGLQERARANTKTMLEGMLRSLGYTTVTITYTTP